LCWIRGKISIQNRLSIDLVFEWLCSFDDILTKSIDYVKVMPRANLSSFSLTRMSEYNTSILLSLLKIASNNSSHRVRILTVKWFMFTYNLWMTNVADTVSFIHMSMSYLTSSIATIVNRPMVNIVTFDHRQVCS